MTDSSSKPDEMADMAAEMMMAKMDASKITHLLRIGTFQMEVSPNENIDVRAFFTETLKLLIDKYGEKLLEIDIKTAMQTSGSMHG
jgi:hypothetical protein|tara:strand:- start:595 stop:852 length:258 start_codon:yes stop_codon:yes gene_type:complete